MSWLAWWVYPIVWLFGAWLSMCVYGEFVRLKGSEADGDAVSVEHAALIASMIWPLMLLLYTIWIAVVGYRHNYAPRAAE